jgi:hypothetical protein
MSQVPIPVARSGAARLIPRSAIARTVAAIAVVLVAGAALAPSADRVQAPVPTSQPVASTTFVCPDAAGGATRSTTLVAAAPGLAPVPAEGPTPEGGGRLAPLARGRTLATVAAPGGGAVVTTNQSLGPVVGAATGAVAPGFSGGQLTVVPAGPERGLAGDVCSPARSDGWFVGGGAASGQRSRLLLINVEPTAAVVDVDLYGPAGPIDAPAGRGVPVAARGVRALDLDALAPGQALVGLRARAESGRVAMALFAAERKGATSRGIDWVPLAAAPARAVVVPAVPGGVAQRRLVVLNPGSDDAQVRVRAVGRDGSFAPEAADLLVVPAGSLATVDVSALGRENTAVRLDSDVPVTAAVRITQPQAPFDFAWTAAAPPVTTAAVAALSRIGGGFSASLVLTAGDEAAVVEVVSGPVGRAGTTRRVEVPAQSTVATAVASGRAAGYWVSVVRPVDGSGPVWAGRVQTQVARGIRLMTISPLRDARISVAVPEAGTDPGAVIRGLS